MRARLLVIDDDEMLCQLLLYRLQSKGFEVILSTSGLEGIRAAFEHRPDLILLDIMMPELDGWEICERLREIADIPIIMLTAKSEKNDIIRGFQLGSEDYVTKPFSLQELELRINAVLKRTEAHRSELTACYDDGELSIDLEKRRVLKNGQMVHLTPTEFRLLSCLVRRRGCIVPSDCLVHEVWGDIYLEGRAYLSLYIHYLRQKIEDDVEHPRYIYTEWGVGYWFTRVDGAYQEPLELEQTI